MATTTNPIQAYINQLSDDKQAMVTAIVNAFDKHLPKGYHKEISYGMIGYVVPKATYPNGYHCNTALPLPFVTVGATKSHVAIYHMGIYATPKLLEWFTTAWPTYTTRKLDMGKSCIKFKKLTDIPIKLIHLLASKMTVHEWIEIYESNFVKKKK